MMVEQPCGGTSLWALGPGQQGAEGSDTGSLGLGYM